MEQPSNPSPVPIGRQPGYAGRSTQWIWLLIFLGSALTLFLTSNRVISVYDEALVLTGALSVMAGQVPYHDFYWIYGPAQLYILAAIFKLFGVSALAARIWDLVPKSFLVVSIFILVNRYAPRRIAAVSALAGLVWTAALNWPEAATVPALVSAIWSIDLAIAAFSHDASGRRYRMLAAGALGGLSTLFRVDYGLAVLGICLALTAVSAWRRDVPLTTRLLPAAAVAFYLLGYLVLVLPAAAAYGAVAPWGDFLFDYYIFQAHHFYAERHVPFPPVHVTSLDNLVIYCTPLVILLCGWAALRQRGSLPDESRTTLGVPRTQWQALLLGCCLLMTALYLKTIVGPSPLGMYITTIPALVVLGILCAQRFQFARSVRAIILTAAAIFWLAPVWTCLRMYKYRVEQTYSIEYLRLLAPATQPPLPPLQSWCAQHNAITEHACYLGSNDDMAAIEYLAARTQPGQTLFVGLTHHDRIFANNLRPYFALRMLPATKWAHFDPDLQTTAPIQSEMIGELERNRPVYVVLDAEFEPKPNQPLPVNDSGISTGVHLLDDYIASHYQPVQTFGKMAVLKRRS